jgi:hypothetical protein
MALAVIVQAHQKPEQLRMLLSTLRDSDVRVYLHIDARADLGEIPDDVVLLPRRRSRWGAAELVDVSLDGLRQGLADGCDYFTLISGQCFPLRPIREIVDFYAAAPSYVEHWPTHDSVHRFHGRDRTNFYSYNLRGRREPAIRWRENTGHINWRGKVLNTLLVARSLVRPKRAFPAYAEPYTGSAWWNLDTQAAEYVVRFVDQHPDFRRWYDHAWIPDEFFYQSILAGTGYPGEVVNGDLRFIEMTDTYHPRTLTMEHLPQMRVSEALFARKFDIDVDRDVLEALMPPDASAAGTGGPARTRPEPRP